jgi:hypothetical protein
MLGVEPHPRAELFPHPSVRPGAHTPAHFARFSRLGVRHGLGCSVFSLVNGLPSATSADGSPLLFGCFVGTTPLYDSPRPYMRGLPLIAFSLRPAILSRRAATGSPGSRAWSFSACLGSSTPPGRVRSRDRPRRAGGQGGSLRLPCTTHSFATPCRFIPALSRAALALRQPADGRFLLPLFE